MVSLQTKPLRVLISGAGVAGPSLAFWLTRLGHSCTIVERSSQLRASGQQIDIRTQGIEAVDRMGLLGDLRKMVVDEGGLQFVNAQSKPIATFPKVDAPPGQKKRQQGFSSEYEMMRGDVCQLLYDKTRQSTEYVFGKHVTAFQNEADGVQVTLSDGETTKYDMLVAADGQSSRTRRLLLRDEDPSVDYSRDLGLYVAFFSIPRLPDDKNMATFCLAPGRKIIASRFHSPTQGQAYMATMAHLDQLKAAQGQDVAAQKALFAEIFRGTGWQSERFIEAMMQCDDFYYQSMTQIRTKIWSKGRVVLLGDAGYSPTPMTGMGTSLAFVGAHVLAGEISRHPNDLSAAFSAYESTLRPWVDEMQKIPRGMPGLAYPKSAWGVKAIEWLVGTSMRLKLNRFVKSGGFSEGGWQLPRYPQLEA
ncbi:hypothetical protein E4U40_001077 [Claviceps sp. LM458 group G5]|nr:hypothetical protein E4U40_001077 [Claviceps sp. LM458 group G5]